MAVAEKITSTSRDPLDSQSIALLIKACRSVSDGHLVHTLVMQSPFYADRFLTNLLIDTYGRCGALDDAFYMFVSIPCRNVFSWNFIIRSCVSNGQARHALSLFDQMAGEHIPPDRVTLLTAVSACAQLKNLDHARRLEKCLLKSDVTIDEVIQSAEISMYYKCGSLEDAERVFDSIQKRDVVCWNAMMTAYSQLGLGAKALVLFDKMLLEGINPSQATYCALLIMCANEGFLSEGRHIHNCLKSNLMELDLTLGNALISMYGKCNSIGEAHTAFDRLYDRDLITWNAIMSAWVDAGRGKEALQLFHQMHMEGLIPDTMIITNCVCACECESDHFAGKRIHSCVLPSVLRSEVIISTALMKLYGKCQNLVPAQKIFDELEERDMVAHNAMIATYTGCGLNKESVQHFKQMQLESIFPGSVTYASILNACGRREGMFMHTQILHTGVKLDNEVCTTLITMYGKYRSLRQLELVLDELGEPDVIVWNALISASVQLEQFDKAFYYLQRLQGEGFIPTAATFASCLSACVTNVGLTRGKYMHTMIIGASLSFDSVVGTALVDMYGKCGSLEFAQVVFDRLKYQSGITWNALVTAYAQHGCRQRAIDLFQVMLLRGICIDDATFSSVLSACSHTGHVDGGVQCFISLLEVCGMKPSVQHFNCLIDLFRRAGRLEESQSIMNLMPAAPIRTTLTALDGAYRTHLGREREID